MKFIPHEYQNYAIRFAEEHREALLLLDMGLGPEQDRYIAAGHHGSDVRPI